MQVFVSLLLSCSGARQNTPANTAYFSKYYHADNVILMRLAVQPIVLM